MILGVSGHRSVIKGQLKYILYDRLLQLALNLLRELGPDEINTGMALGWDQAIAEAAQYLDIPYTAYVPFVGQENSWPLVAQEKYRLLLEDAQETIVCSDTKSVSAYFKRNKDLVDASNFMLVLWDGRMYGGTYDAVCYAKSLDIHVRNVWREWEEIKKGA